MFDSSPLRKDVARLRSGRPMEKQSISLYAANPRSAPTVRFTRRSSTVFRALTPLQGFVSLVRIGCARRCCSSLAWRPAYRIDDRPSVSDRANYRNSSISPIATGVLFLSSWYTLFTARINEANAVSTLATVRLLFDVARRPSGNDFKYHACAM